MNNPRLLEIEHLKINFKTFEGTKPGLDIEHLDIMSGESFGLLGESGAGKTVFALALFRLLSTPPAKILAGRILFDGEDLLEKTEREMREIRGKKMAMIFQDPLSALNPVSTVGSQLIGVIRQNRGLPKKAAKKQAFEYMERVKLPDPRDTFYKYPHELSGGMRQRVIIALGISCGAKFLVADEPTRNLDVTIQAGILKLLAKLKQELNITMLFIANNPNLMPIICDRIAVLCRGVIVETGTTKEIFRNPLHPYTILLLRSIPKSKEEDIDLDRSFPKTVSSSEVEGCRYLSRCPEAKDKCQDKQPTLKLISNSHLVACYQAMEVREHSAE